MSNKPPKIFTITNGPEDLPDAVLFARCKAIHVEFLLVSTHQLSGRRRIEAQRKNHAVFKIDFEKPLVTAGGHYRGIRLTMDPVENFNNPAATLHPGELNVKLVPYELISNSAARFCSLGRSTENENRQFRVQDILRLLTTSNMHEFDFVVKDEFLQGCRDFVTQAVYLMSMVGLVTPTITNVLPKSSTLDARDIYHALAMRHSRNGTSRQHPIDCGHFRNYVRIRDRRMRYAD